MSENLQAVPSPCQIRSELEELVRKDLLGPKGGPEEIIDEPAVRGRYVVGILAPKEQTAFTEEPRDLVGEQTELAIAGEDTEDGVADSQVPKAVSMLPSSIAMTFTLDRGAEAIRVTARWGSYKRVASETLKTKTGTPKRVWKRVPVEEESEPIALVHGKRINWIPCSDYEEVTVQGIMRLKDDQWTITLYLVNGQYEPKQNKDEAWIFQAELMVESPDGAPIFLRRTGRRSPAKADLEDLAVQTAYRKEVEFAVGHGVAVHADLAEGRWDRAARLTTRAIPSYEVPKATPPTVDEVPELADVILDMKELSEIADSEFGKALCPLTNAYEKWIKFQAQRLENPSSDLAPFPEAAQHIIENARRNLERIRHGMELLVTDPNAAEAFRFANRAMWQQRIHSTYARMCRQGQETELEDVDTPEERRWYPFQLAFILLNLPSITDIHHHDRSHQTEAIADLLWYPTGGGKTEAYLGLTAYTLALRRLQGKVGGYSGHAGVAVLMRYTLRLLTLQQFQRATALICACESIRREDEDKWGEESFRIGLWIGQRSTPNWTDDSAEAIKQGHGQYGGVSGRGTPYQLTFCPWCGSKINLGKHLRAEIYGEGRCRTITYCGDKTGQCLFSARKSRDEGLPVVVVDEEIYRRLPSLLISTADKFAQMPWRGETQMLFGRVSGYCTRHGYRSPEIRDSDTHPKRRQFPSAKTIPVGKLRPPDLIIQDELHLISGPLGTLVGLYETAIEQLSSWEVDGKTVRPKVIASTATIRHAESQVYSLYLRRVNIFPPSGIDIEDNFFSRQRGPSEENPGRLYLGVCAPGIRTKSVLIRVYVAYMAAAQQLFEKYGKAVDPYMTLVGYFNAMRELGGTRRAVEDSVRSRLRRMPERGLSRRFINPFNVEELTSRKSASDIPRILDRLEVQFEPGEGRGSKGQNRPLDVLLATNMISVGVDVNRLGLMVVAGQPKTTSEYIQATSRVGRHHPGIVCVVYNWARPRDLSHYERFEHYHATLYQHVEALSVTPFSPRARDRGLTGVLVSLIRLPGEEFNKNIEAGSVKRDHTFPQTAIEVISQRAMLIEGSNEIGTEVKQELEERLDEWLSKAQQISGGGGQLGYRREKGTVTNLLEDASGRQWTHFTCLNSLRDVEPNVGLVLDNFGMDRGPTPGDRTTEEGGGEA